MRLLKFKTNYEAIKGEYSKLFQEFTKLKEYNSNLEETANQIIALYDITREICKTLDEDKIFACFKDRLESYLKVDDCRFIKGDIDLSQYVSYTVLPLEIDKKTFGYLVANNIKEEDKDKFYILSQQVILGIKRALLYRQVQELAITDSLTGILTRRYFLERFAEEIERSKKQNFNFSFLMVDIDYFKGYNDHYGHLVGDVILKEVSKTIKENIRQIDLVGKYGGDEFSLILSETDKSRAGFVAERIRNVIEVKHVRAYDEDLKITVSIGIAIFPSDATDLEQLIEKADESLYRAKQSGRNKVCLYSSKKSETT